ncbi:sensor histidine kinase [Pseudoalteromonas piscicida]|uniref:sensor histidine kinase n=1 Tax=Pseudoalteromonas piscicida TaxID=43662 RepID=UPI0030A44AB4
MWRFVFALLTILTLASVITGLIFDTLIASSSENNEAHYDPLSTTAPIIAAMAKDNIPESQIITIPLHQTLTAQLVPRADYPLPVSLSRKLSQQRFIYLESESSVSACILTSQENVYILTMQKQLQTKYALLMTLLFYAIVIVVVVAFLTPFIARLLKLKNAAHQLGKGKLNARVQVGTVWYLKDIEQAFNQMARQIAGLMTDMKLLSSGLSHELRTPLARVRMGLDTLVETHDDELRAQYEDRINQNLDEMEQVIDAILDYARLQHRLDDVELQPVDLNAMARLLANNAHYQGLTLKLSSKPCWVIGEGQYLRMLINNLLSNAIKYANAKISLETRVDNDKVKLIIEDDGIGISNEVRDKVLLPFYRDDSQSQSGYGIGLAFVQRIVTRFGGTLVIQKSPALGGAKITVSLIQTQQK